MNLVLTHELVHALMDIKTGGFKLPVWIHEAVAEFLSCKIHQCQLDWFAGRNLKFLSEEIFSANFTKMSSPKAKRAYLQSHYIFRYIESEYGREKIYKILDKISPQKLTPAKIFQAVDLDLQKIILAVKKQWEQRKVY